jgi:hypothetical protein
MYGIKFALKMNARKNIFQIFRTVFFVLGLSLSTEYFLLLLRNIQFHLVINLNINQKFV